MSEIILLAILLLVVWTMVVYFLFQFFSWRKKMRKEVEEVGETLDWAFQRLREKIEKEIEFLDNQVGLSEKEKELRDRLEESLTHAKEMTEKEIEDIRKMIE